MLACVAHARRTTGRLAVVRRLDLPDDDRWATLVHPAACTTPLRIGAHVVAMPHALITHDDKIADGVTFAGGALLGGSVTVEWAAAVWLPP
jgi:hypothetical protein